MSGFLAVSPLSGWATNLDAVPDPVFAERMLGDGMAIDPVEGLVRAPVAGRVLGLHAARHAITIESDEGAVLLIHVGLDTVALAGEGFRAEVAEGDRVAAGDPLMAFDLDAVGRGARSLITPVILTNGDAFAIEFLGSDRAVVAGEPLFRLIPRGSVEASTIDTGAAVERTLRLPLRHGIHARPAARIAELARSFDAWAQIVAEDGRTASALSPVAMLALALPHGVTIRIHAQGPQREAVADAIATLIASGMNEGAPFETSTGTLPTAPLHSTLRGVVAAPGFAIGPAWHLRQATIAVPMVGAGLDHERTALRNALDALRTSLAGNVWVDDDVAAIADARLAFLADPELIAAAEAGISVGQSAGQAWRTVIGGFVAALQRAADKRFAERIADLRDLEYQLLGELYGRTEEVAAPAGAILVAAELLSSQLMALAGKGIAGVATGGGGPTSHVAIIAAGMGLPMLVALGDDVERIAGGAMLLLDSEAATLAIDPPAALLSERRAAAAEAARFRSEAQLRAHEPALTIDGTRIELFANLGSVEDARVAVDAGAEGCGLLRTEFLFLDRPTAPSEEEQRATCQAIADALGDCPLIVRTLDIGADKPAPYLPLPPEENPALGLRGLRLGLSRPELLRGQLRALLRVKGPVRIMLPMVVEPGEVAQVREMLHEIATEIGRDAPPLGIMVETPAAAMLAGPLARVADFFSIGSNDLTQYALAMDRGNPAVAARADGLHPAVLRLIAATVEGARTADRWTGVCGGIAADPLAVPILIGLGITELSVPPAMVAETKARVRRTSMVACRALAVEVLKMDKATDVRARVRHFIEEGQGA